MIFIPSILTSPMPSYYVCCPETGESETVTDLDRATDICYSMSECESKYAYVRDDMGSLVLDYGDVLAAVENHYV
tara:strand:- start:689 stop:913 length:225 start_codon:yes stop_codon:yes gene_type:complete